MVGLHTITQAPADECHFYIYILLFFSFPKTEVYIGAVDLLCE